MKPDVQCFDSEMRARCRVIVVGRAALDDMVRRRHYLKRWPGVVVKCYCLLRDGQPVGACVYALPPRETAKRYGGMGWELARLWVDDAMPQNTETWFVAATIRKIRSECSVDFLVSYADPSFGHEGLIYKAGNWVRDGRTDEERKTPRFDYIAAQSDEGLFGSQNKHYSRRGHVPEGVAVKRVARNSKNRFVMFLKRARELSI